SETPKGNLKWLPVTSIAGTADQLAAAELSFSTESAKSGRCHCPRHGHCGPGFAIRLLSLAGWGQ
ncbi:hypothetical protein, partial [Pseudomonas aeruginosa]|uniref:hypothetical protein n=1 Tax=Pseudomonas aeruginosa TaxID=287 RepID=UPI002904751A